MGAEMGAGWARNSGNQGGSVEFSSEQRRNKKNP